jgi:hypothetical protein
MMRNAEQQRITLSDDDLKASATALKNLGVNEQGTWDAVLRLASYRTFVNYVEAGTPTIAKYVSDCTPGEGHQLEVRRNDFYNCTVRLGDGLYEDNTFGNVTFIYNGAVLLIMRKNRFYNCKFQITNNEKGRMFVIRISVKSCVISGAECLTVAGTVDKRQQAQYFQ